MSSFCSGPYPVLFAFYYLRKDQLMSAAELDDQEMSAMGTILFMKGTIR